MNETLKSMVYRLLGFAGMALVATGAKAQTYDSGSTGALGDLVVAANQEIVLPADGVLDYASFTINASRTVTFKRNSANTPVIIRVQGDVTINGSIDISGAVASSTVPGIGYSAIGGLAGPGGGDGGACEASGTRAGAGTGPGGGRGHATLPAGGGASPIENGTDGYALNNSYNGKAFADWRKQQLFGGSGGGCGAGTWAGSGGGGVITIAASGTITINGSIRSRGGAAYYEGGAGGGGVIRLVATTITGAGSLDVRGSNAGQCAISTTSVRGGCGGDGLIKVEGYNVSGAFITSATPADAVYFGKPQPAIPGGSARPTVTITSITGATGGAQNPGSPDWSVQPHRQTPAVFLDDGNTVTVAVTTTNVEPGKSVRVRLNTLGPNTNIEANSVALVGTLASATATATLTLPTGTRLLTVEAWVLDITVPQP